MSGFSVCAPTNIPLVKTCLNTNTMTTSLNANLGPLTYKFDGDHSVSLCGKIPYIPIASVCGGVKYDGNSIDPFVSLNIAMGNINYQYKPNIDTLYNKIVGEKCNTTLYNGVIENNNITNGTFVTKCKDAQTTMTISPEFIADPNNVNQMLQKYDKVISELQDKTQKIMETKGITEKDIGMVMTRAPSNIPKMSTEQMALQTTVIAVNEIIVNVKTNIPNFTVFDLLGEIQKNAIDRDQLMTIIKMQQNPDQSTWRVEKDKNLFYPDCCENGKLGWFIDYHIVNKIDHCRCCLTPYRLEYFL